MKRLATVTNTAGTTTYLYAGTIATDESIQGGLLDDPALSPHKSRPAGRALRRSSEAILFLRWATATTPADVQAAFLNALDDLQFSILLEGGTVFQAGTVNWGGVAVAKTRNWGDN